MRRGPRPPYPPQLVCECGKPLAVVGEATILTGGWEDEKVIDLYCCSECGRELPDPHPIAVTFQLSLGEYKRLYDQLIFLKNTATKVVGRTHQRMMENAHRESDELILLLADRMKLGKGDKVCEKQ